MKVRHRPAQPADVRRARGFAMCSGSPPQIAAGSHLVCASLRRFAAFAFWTRPQAG